MDFENIIVEYVKNVEEVPSVGQMRVHVRISEDPMFNDARSMNLTYYSNRHNMSMGGSTISYKSVRAESYRQRMEVNVVLPGGSLNNRVKPYRESRNATKKLLPKIIAEHERRMLRE